jgi:hypothetical protein
MAFTARRPRNQRRLRSVMASSGGLPVDGLASLQADVQTDLETGRRTDG